VERVRDTGEPFFLLLDTYRFSPHSKGDDNRDPAEIEKRRERDPLTIAAARLDEGERRAIERAAEQRLAETIAAAEEAPAATPEAA
jgi:TPP-dependent pyruvate/acetoin dehydrogenase alpha subunit